MVVGRVIAKAVKSYLPEQAELSQPSTVQRLAKAVKDAQMTNTKGNNHNDVIKGK